MYVCVLQVMLHAPLLRSFYLGEGHDPGSCRLTARAKPCLSCQMVRRAAARYSCCGASAAAAAAHEPSGLQDNTQSPHGDKCNPPPCCAVLCCCSLPRGHPSAPRMLCLVRFTRATGSPTALLSFCTSGGALLTAWQATSSRMLMSSTCHCWRDCQARCCASDPQQQQQQQLVVVLLVVKVLGTHQAVASNSNSNSWDNSSSRGLQGQEQQSCQAAGVPQGLSAKVWMWRT